MTSKLTTVKRNTIFSTHKHTESCGTETKQIISIRPLAFQNLTKSDSLIPCKYPSKNAWIQIFGGVTVTIP